MKNMTKPLVKEMNLICRKNSFGKNVSEKIHSTLYDVLEIIRGIFEFSYNRNVFLEGLEFKIIPILNQRIFKNSSLHSKIHKISSAYTRGKG